MIRCFMSVVVSTLVVRSVPVTRLLLDVQEKNPNTVGVLQSVLTGRHLPSGKAAPGVVDAHDKNLRLRTELGQCDFSIGPSYFRPMGEAGSKAENISKAENAVDSKPGLFQKLIGGLHRAGLFFVLEHGSLASCIL